MQRRRVPVHRVVGRAGGQWRPGAGHRAAPAQPTPGAEGAPGPARADRLEDEGILVAEAVVTVGGMVGGLGWVLRGEGGDQAGHLLPHAAVQL